MSNVAFLDEGPRVLSVYEGFFSGGARVHHTAVVRSLDATTGQRHSVLSLTDRSAREGGVQNAADDASYRRLQRAGVPITALDRLSGQPMRRFHMAAMERALSRTDVVLSLKEQPLETLAIVGRVGRPVIACLHRSDPEHQGSALDALVTMVDAGVVTSAICCAVSTQTAYHQATGIPLAQLPVIPNGTDLRRFRPMAPVRHALRAALGVVGDAPVVLLSARFDPMKDVGLFLRAAAEFVRRYPNAHFVLCGAGMTAANRELVAMVDPVIPHEQLHLLGIREDMPDLYNAADLVALTSAYGEAAPLSLLEGMACGAVPVTTDIGDAALMVADPRLVVPREADLVALGWEAAFEQREEHTERIFRHRQRLSDQRCFDSYAHLIRATVDASRMRLAV